MPEGRINKITGLQETKFLRLFGLVRFALLVFMRPNVTVYLCV
jgi:hypothetical protein